MLCQFHERSHRYDLHPPRLHLARLHRPRSPRSCAQNATSGQLGLVACARDADQVVPVGFNVSFVTRSVMTSRALMRTLNSSSFSHFFACRVRSAASASAAIAAVFSHDKCDTSARVKFHIVRMVRARIASSSVKKSRIAKSGRMSEHWKRSAQVQLGGMAVLRRFTALFLLTPVVLPIIIMVLCTILYSWHTCKCGKRQQSRIVMQAEDGECTASPHGHREHLALLQAAAHDKQQQAGALSTRAANPSANPSDDGIMWRQIVREQIYK